MTAALTSAAMFEVAALLDGHHYIGSQCADPTYVFAYREPGGLFGDRGDPVCAACFAPPASSAWGATAIELSRLVRAPEMTVPLTKFVGDCLRWIARDRRFDVVVAYADPAAGHHGGIYQAGNWLYVGRSASKRVYVNDSSGVRMSQRSFDQSTLRGSEQWRAEPTGRKLTYVYPLTRARRAEFIPRREAYPKPSRMIAGTR